MTIDIENSCKDISVPDYRRIIETVINQALDFEKCPYEAQVYVLLTDDSEIHRINREQRNIDRATDVLSFPMTDYPVPGDFRDLEEREPDAFHPRTGELLLGDTIISMDKVRSQAEEYGHSKTRELAFLTAHSLLHLIGYDHMEENERLIMEEKQRTILELCGYTREEKR